MADNILDVSINMEWAKLILEFIEAVSWPIITVVIMIIYHKDIRSLLKKRSNITFTIAGVTIETSIETLQQSVEENFRERLITDKQWEWLNRLKKAGRQQYKGEYYGDLRPLRNTGLIREHPEGWLSNAKEIELTQLGNLLLQAHQKQTHV